MNTTLKSREAQSVRYPKQMSYLVTMDSFLPHSGGSRVYYSELYRSLLAQYPDTVTLLTKKVPGWRQFDALERSAKFRIRRRFEPLSNWKYWQLPKAFPQLGHAAAVAITGHYDCLHCGDLFPQALTGVLLSKVFRLPLVVFCHGDEISQTDKRRYQPRVRDFIYRQADAIVAANQFAYDRLLRIGIPMERIHKLTPGVNFKDFRPRPRRDDLIESYGLQGKKVLLTVARLVSRKGHKIVLQSLPAVMREVPDLKYLVVGDGPEKRNLQALVSELHLGDVVTFIGDVPHDQVCDFYNLCDIFVMVNRLEAGGDVESFGMAFTEANAVGKPVIGGRSGGTAEAVIEGETGFLVDPDCAEEVSDRLLLLLKDDQLRKNMGAAGLDRMRAEFDWSSRGQALRRISAAATTKISGQAYSPGLEADPQEPRLSV